MNKLLILVTFIFCLPFGESSNKKVNIKAEENLKTEQDFKKKKLQASLKTKPTYRSNFTRSALINVQEMKLSSFKDLDKTFNSDLQAINQVDLNETFITDRIHYIN